MKRVFLITISLVLTGALIIVSCTKNKADITLEDPNNLSDDKAFIEFTNETYDYLEFISNKMKQSGLKSSEIQNRIVDLQAKNLQYNEQMSAINEIFKSNVSERLASHMKAYNSTWKSLTSRYKNISRETLNKECSEVLSKRYTNSSNSQNTTLSKAETSETCGWKYYLCSGAATAGAVLCHGGCEGTAIATTAGLGIPACVVACGTLQAYAIVQCHDTYCHN